MGKIRILVSVKHNSGEVLKEVTTKATKRFTPLGM
jgi:hypothetical protein